MDLSQAEAVMDVISADSELALAAAERQLAGALKQKVRSISESLYQVFASLEMMVEFPEHEDTPGNTEAVIQKLKTSDRLLTVLKNTFSQ